MPFTTSEVGGVGQDVRGVLPCRTWVAQAGGGGEGGAGRKKTRHRGNGEGRRQGRQPVARVVTLDGRHV